MPQIEVLVEHPLGKDQLAELALGLSQEFRESRIQVADPPHAQEVDGARGQELLAHGLVLVQIAMESGAVRWLIDRIRDWRARTGVPAVEVRLGDAFIRVDEATEGQQEALIAAFISAAARTK
jgi:hypothetical protein